jgi:hypothetical protein
MNSMASAVDAVSTTLKVKAEDLEHGIRDDLEGAYCIYAAGIQAESYAPDAILEETGCQISALISGILPGLMQMLKVVGATTVLGAGIGGAVGLFAGGAGAAPGLVIGGELGFDIGMAALTWMGLGFLVYAIAEGFVELYEALHTGVEWAWQAKGLKDAAQKEQLDKAAHKMAQAAGILMRLVLQGIMAELLRRVAVKSTSGALSTGRAIGTKGVAGAADASVAELIGKLRGCKFGKGFGDWIEKNWEKLKDNPKLKPKGAAAPAIAPAASAEGTGTGSAQDSGSAAKSSGKSDEGSGSEEQESPAAKKDTAASVVRQSGQIKYGSSDLSKTAIDYRQTEGITGGRNVAVVEYRAADGSLQTVAAASERGVGHAERIAANELSEMGVQPSQVTRIYSELQPCNVPGGYCASFISRTFPQADVTWSFEYGATPESRAAGVAALKAAQDAAQ